MTQTPKDLKKNPTIEEIIGTDKYTIKDWLRESQRAFRKKEYQGTVYNLYNAYSLIPSENRNQNNPIFKQILSTLETIKDKFILGADDYLMHPPCDEWNTWPEVEKKLAQFSEMAGYKVELPR